MATEGLGPLMTPAVILLSAAVVAVPLFRRLGLGSVLGYFAAGLAVGPFGFGFFSDPEAMLTVSELGVVLFLFIIMLLDVDKSSQTRRPLAKAILGAIVLGVTVGTVVFALTQSALPVAGPGAAPTPDPLNAPLPHGTSAKTFGYGLFTKYMLPVQVAGFLLLSAMIGVVTLVRRPKDAA